MHAGSKGFVGCLSSVQFNHVAPLKAALLNRGSSLVTIRGPLVQSNCGLLAESTTSHTLLGNTLTRCEVNGQCHYPKLRALNHWTPAKSVLVDESVVSTRETELFVPCGDTLQSSDSITDVHSLAYSFYASLLHFRHNSGASWNNNKLIPSSVMEVLFIIVLAVTQNGLSCGANNPWKKNIHWFHGSFTNYWKLMNLPVSHFLSSRSSCK